MYLEQIANFGPLKSETSIPKRHSPISWQFSCMSCPSPLSTNAAISFLVPKTPAFFSAVLVFRKELGFKISHAFLAFLGSRVAHPGSSRCQLTSLGAVFRSSKKRTSGCLKDTQKPWTKGVDFSRSIHEFSEAILVSGRVNDLMISHKCTGSKGLRQKLIPQPGKKLLWPSKVGS